MKCLLKSSEQLFSDLQEQLTQSRNTHPTPLLQSKAAIPICLQHVRALRSHLKSFRDVAQQDEIYFFKHIKPKFMSEYYFNEMVYRLHYSWPMGDLKKQEQHLEEGFHQITHFFEQNQHFYCYYRTNSTHLDNHYFIRGQYDIEPSPGHLICGTDPEFHTPGDLLVGQVLANHQFQEYLQEQVQQLRSPQQRFSAVTQTQPALVWSDSKSALIELIYGLHFSRVFNGGNADIKTIVAVLGQTFGVDLKNVYDYMYHIKMRKLEPTKFTDRMKQCLLQNFTEQ